MIKGKMLLLVWIVLFNCQWSIVNCQVTELTPFGDMDRWVVREIKESAVIGGKTKLLYELGPKDTIRGAEPYTNRGGSPWANSNVLAKVAGVVKTNTSVFPEERANGYCVRMETRFESVKVIGLINIEVIAAGSVYLGEMLEPIKGTKNPMAMLNCGIPFTRKPSALSLDYKVKVAPEPNRIRCTGFSPRSTVEGKDEAVIILILQKRWEDEKGNLFAKRVGTMMKRYNKDVDWVNNAVFPVLYGDISNHPEYQPYMKIQDEERYALNSKGKNVPIQEVGWADDNEEPTHLILHFASSHGGAYIGSPGNTFWIDNVKLVY
ncbi:MAG: PCMD domain-containing protein [Tannerellaceae bacterium]|nr:PCMD domain-containing protein [Tannerellaceae bacterium]